jgi:hypothetical protein
MINTGGTVISAISSNGNKKKGDCSFRQSVKTRR